MITRLCRGAHPRTPAYVEAIRLFERGHALLQHLPPSVARTQRELGVTESELRAAMSLARLQRERGGREQARAVLSEVYGRFTEGFETRDLRGARGLLAEMA